MFSRCILIIAVFIALFASPAFAEKGTPTKSLGTFGAWQAYASSESGQKVCYMALRTHGAPLKKAKRGPVILMITQRPAENARDVVSYNAGYNFKATSDLRITFGKANFDLFTKADTAWSRDAMTDHALATAIRSNSTLNAIGIPATHGAKQVTDMISLKGAGDAYLAIGKACGMALELLSKPAQAHKSKPAQRK